MIMKKYFIFAAVAAAGLFASCSSSDDIAANDAQNPIEDPDKAPQIRLNIGNIVDLSTRGTGTVGGVGTGTNQWAGQHINVFMFTKDENKQTTLNLTDISTNATPQYLYNNTDMVTPGSAENLIPGMGVSANRADGEAMISDGTIQYYPLQGNFDFFGYHVDDANENQGPIVKDGASAVEYYSQTEIDDAADAYSSDNVADMDPTAQATWMTAHPAYGKSTTDVKTPASAGTLWKLPFLINGTQDVMSTKAALTTGQSALVGDDYYSAKAARKEVQPTLTFKHLLTRLQFVIKAGNDAAGGLTGVTPAVYYTQTECDTHNAGLAGALAATAGPFYSFTACSKAELGNPSWTTTGKVQFIKEQTESSGDYTIIQVIQNNLVDHAQMDGKYFAVKETATNLAASLANATLDLYWVTKSGDTYTIGSTTETGTILEGGAISVYNLATVETAAATAAINAYNATLTGAWTTSMVKTAASGGTVDATLAVKVTGIQALSANTKGDLAVAWTGDLEDDAKISWTATQPAEADRWLTLMERPAYKQVASPAASLTADDFTDLATKKAALDNTAADYATKLAELNDEATARYKEKISAPIFALLTTAAQANYEEITIKENEKLIALTPTSPTVTTTETGAARYPETPIGEAIILSPSTADISMKVNVSQKVKTNWDGTTDDKEQTYPLTITAPSGGFKPNTSYKVILTVYGFERIEVHTVIVPWEPGEDIEVGQD